ncbi:hypothetical protein [Acinetobacter sp. YH12052]|nr:hypothetical protein [Acinetobacter sp. YH12052]
MSRLDVRCCDHILHAAMKYALVIIYAFVGMRFYIAMVAGW